MCNTDTLGDCCGARELVARTKSTNPMVVPAGNVLEVGIWDVLRRRSVVTLTPDIAVQAAVDAPSPRFRGWIKQVGGFQCNGKLVFQERSTDSDNWMVVTSFDVPPLATDIVQPFGLVCTARFVRAFFKNDDGARQMEVFLSLISGADE